MNLPPSIQNGQPFDTAACPLVSMDDFRQTVIQAVASGARLVALCGQPTNHGSPRLLAVLARPEKNDLAVVSADVPNDAYPALTPECTQAHWFEREIAEQWCVHPIGHPWLKPIRFQPPRRNGNDVCGRHTNFFSMTGDEVHEVAVGPVHAGIIEPGHFRFQCHGETVYHLEISLGYQHRGIERAIVAGPEKRVIHYMETAAGDTTAAHTTAYCHAIEALSKTPVPARAQAIRGLAMEWERVANHVGDLGALAGDVGFLPTMSYCGRIRGDVLNMTALLCGNRFGRGLIRPGGVAFDLDEAMIADLRRRWKVVFLDLLSAIQPLWHSKSVWKRFEQTGTVPADICRQLGLVGVAARACGENRDVRHEFPSGIYRSTPISPAIWDTGDVLARAYVRWMEIVRLRAFIDEQLASLPAGPVRELPHAIQPNQMVVSLVEGWRGEICHIGRTDETGRLVFYKIIDPSLHNWLGLAYALRGQAISDFPLCNKSFNLSYCGHDL